MLTRALAEAGAPIGVGFIERLEGTGEPVYRVHDLWHHAPDYVAKRRRREMDRQGKSDPRPPNGAERRRHEECQDGVVRPPSPSPSPSPGKNDVSSGSTRHEPAELTFPTSGKPDSWDLTHAQVSEWQRLYDGLDVRAECRKALAWVTSTTGHKKTAGGMARFLVNWLNRATNAGGSRRGAAAPPSQESAEAAAYREWKAHGGCPHAPRCGNYTTCRAVSARTRAS